MDKYNEKSDNNRLTGYDLSRQWFDFAFDNPDKVTPVHAALYFFTMELNNRLGWKEKFGLPTYHAMEAIGVKAYNTYKKAFNDLVKWGFIRLIEKSKNQHKANIIALSNFDRPTESALSNFDKALNLLYQKNAKHVTKQVESTVVIDKPINYKTFKPITGKKSFPEKTWRTAYNIYLESLREAYKKTIKDKAFIKQQEELNPGVNIELSIKKSCINYWGTEEGWQNKKAKRIKNINWKRTFVNAITQRMNRVYKGRETEDDKKTYAKF